MMPLPTDAEFRKLFQRLEREGALLLLLSLIRAEMEEAETALKVALRTVKLTDATSLAEFHQLQGRISGFARLLTVFREYGTRPPADPPPIPGT